MKSIVFSHKGKREVNQDYILVQKINHETYLYLIADGMGGYEHGEIAAKLVAENVLTFLSTVETINEAQIQKAINKANLAIKQFCKKNNSKAGATIGGVILQANQAVCFWVGDIKIFHFNNNQLINESTSHTLINEIKNNGSIKDSKQINKYKHVVTRSVQGEVEFSVISLFKIENISSTDIIIICSDGITDYYTGMCLQYLLVNSISIDYMIGSIEKNLLEVGKDNFSIICINCNSKIE